VSLFDAAGQPRPPSKLRRYLISVVAVIIVGSITGWWVLRFHSEKVVIRHFMDAVVAGNMERAYQIWKPAPSYSFKDFQDDWGEQGYYGPVRSYSIKDAEDSLRHGSAAVITVRISPYAPFPDENDGAKQAKTKEVKLWVQYGDKSISFPPF
jgi:hypothetical protein